MVNLVAQWPEFHASKRDDDILGLATELLRDLH